MTRGFSRRGQPLIVLVLVLGGWVSARAMMWDPATLAPLRPMVTSSEQVAAQDSPVSAQPDPGQGGPDRLVRLEGGMSVPMGPGMDASDAMSAIPDQPGPAPAVSLAYRSFAQSEPAPGAALRAPRQPMQLAPPPPVFAPIPVGMAGGHQLLWLAALANLPVPAFLLGQSAESAAAAPSHSDRSELRQTPGRWSADGWLLWRRGSVSSLAGGLLTPSYGASQVGAVLRYRLVPDSPHRPALYLRATAALNGSNERDAALGLSLRPFSRLPLALQGEARLTSTPTGHFVRPAVYAVTELPPFALPLGLRGEAYGQAGYVGGKFATGFADGQLRVDHRLFQLGKADLRLGGGTWGGIQKGASRLDAGPTLSIGHPFGGAASMRLAADWRFRIAGKAAPGSGPAVTLSAGF